MPSPFAPPREALTNEKLGFESLIHTLTHTCEALKKTGKQNGHLRPILLSRLTSIHGIRAVILPP